MIFLRVLDALWGVNESLRRDLRETQGVAVRLAKAYLHAEQIARRERALRYAERQSAAAEKWGDHYAVVSAGMDEADARNALRRLGVEP